MTKQSIYKIKLFKYQRVRGYFEELIIADFNPAKVNGFGIELNKPKTPKAFVNNKLTISKL